MRIHHHSQSSVLSLKYPIMATSELLVALFCVAWLIISNNGVDATYTGITRHYKFDIKQQNVTRLCHTKSIVTVNGQFPGPRIVAREGDRVVVKVVNHVQNNITIHWYQLNTNFSNILHIFLPFFFLFFFPR